MLWTNTNLLYIRRRIWVLNLGSEWVKLPARRIKVGVSFSSSYSKTPQNHTAWKESNSSLISYTKLHVREGKKNRNLVISLLHIEERNNSLEWCISVGLKRRINNNKMRGERRDKTQAKQNMVRTVISWWKHSKFNEICCCPSKKTPLSP